MMSQRRNSVSLLQVFCGRGIVNRKTIYSIVLLLFSAFMDVAILHSPTLILALP